MLFTVFGGVLMEKAIKHPQAPQGAKKVVPHFRGKELFFVDEERSGGVAAIEQPPQDENEAEFTEWRVGLRA